MGIFVSLIAIAILIVIGTVGANAPQLFGVYIPYAAIALFLVGIVIRIFKWAKSPVPFRIPTTCGQEKSLDWIRQNKLDNPSSKLGVIGRMLLEVLFFRSLFRNTKAGISNGTKLVYGETKWLWAMSLAFHWSFLIVFIRHFRFFSDEIAFFIKPIESLDAFLQIGVPEIYITNALIMIGLSYLFFRRLLDARVRYISLSSDYFPLLLILSIATTGILMRYFYKVDLVGVKELAVGLLTFNPVVPEGISAMFYVHLFLVSALLIYFPMSKLVHMAGVFMSPTRNMANNNRAVHHENPWKADLKMHHHTYEEYEDEFRDLMKGVGLPLDKEGDDVSKN